MLFLSLLLVFAARDLPTDLWTQLCDTMNPSFETLPQTFPPDQAFESTENGCMDPFLKRASSVSPEAVLAGIDHFLFLKQALLEDGTINILQLPDGAPRLFKAISKFYIENTEISPELTQQFQQLIKDLDI